ncbi:MAG: hypothetical protein ABI729_06805, partial [Chitinophagales bacterium]
MNIYEQKNTWKLILLITLLLIIITSLLYTNFLAGKLAGEERKKMELLADVYKQLNATSGNVDLGFMFHIIESNETVPLILTDESDNVIGHKNLDSLKIERDTNYLHEQLNLMKADRPPIDIEYSKDAHSYIYYRDSYLLVQLRYYPFVQFSIILLFLAVA